MIRTQISLTEQQAEVLRRLAAVRSTSQAALIRDALDALAADETRASHVHRARQAIGAFSSDHTDTSERHDDLLDEAYAS